MSKSTELIDSALRSYLAKEFTVESFASRIIDLNFMWNNVLHNLRLPIGL